MVPLPATDFRVASISTTRALKSLSLVKRGDCSGRFEGLHQSDFFDGEAFAADRDNILWLVFHEHLQR
jgi:hypothetical protein